ncbi:hypothetical protein GR217_34305 [Rhizobium leguminosarum]|uniref:Uncharacterized protein n=1 Tax=Rhizobium ruizarguesonis TaxID=2081791 RepID=A0AAE5C4I9_9HYPH|nr:hypothetical protein [Rhizobium ruizarguesonis]NEI52693.1 hypothetical protein [Rhizobium ruizarguesonis]
MTGPQINTLPRIDSVWMAVSVDDDGSEGICAILHNGMWMPLLAADEARLAAITEEAKIIAATQGRLIRIIKLNSREEVKAIDGRH